MKINVYTKTALAIQKAFNFYDPLSCGVHREFDSSFYYPVFIIGAPRSGSTLLYQLLLKYGRFAYISNLMSLMPGFMIILARLFKNFHGIEQIKSSQYGYIPGLFSPSEAGAIFQKWFEKEIVETSARKRIRNTFVLTAEYLNAPLLSKNLKNSLRLQNIYKTLPEARFIYIKRDPLFNAQSILLARRKLMRGDYEWWSVAPENYKSILNKNPMYQVLWQVLEINKQLFEFIKNFDPKYIEVSYESLCNDPESEIGNIVDEMGCAVCQNKIETIPLASHNQIRLDLSEWEKLKSFYENMQEIPKP